MAEIKNPEYFAKNVRDISLANFKKQEDRNKLYIYDEIIKQKRAVWGYEVQLSKIGREVVDMSKTAFDDKHCIYVEFYDPEDAITYHYDTTNDTFKTLSLLNQMAYMTKHNNDPNRLLFSIKAKQSEKDPTFDSLLLCDKNGQPVNWYISNDDLIALGIYKNTNANEREQKLIAKINELYDVCEQFYNKFKVPESDNNRNAQAAPAEQQPIAPPQYAQPVAVPAYSAPTNGNGGAPVNANPYGSTYQPPQPATMPTNDVPPYEDDVPF